MGSGERRKAARTALNISHDKGIGIFFYWVLSFFYKFHWQENDNVLCPQRHSYFSVRWLGLLGACVLLCLAWIAACPSFVTSLALKYCYSYTDEAFYGARKPLIILRKGNRLGMPFYKMSQLSTIDYRQCLLLDNCVGTWMEWFLFQSIRGADTWLCLSVRREGWSCLSSRKAPVAFPPHLMDKKRRNPYQESNYFIHLSLFFRHFFKVGLVYRSCLLRLDWGLQILYDSETFISFQVDN